jgi:apolipoprotein N-acyltransferase
MLGLAYSVEWAAPLVWVAMLPFLCVLNRASVREGMGWGLFLGMASHAVAAWWVANVLEHFGTLQLTQILLGTSIALFTQGFQMLLFGAGGAWLSSTWGLRPWLWALCFVWIEILYPRVLPWALAEPLVSMPFWVQGADLVGVSGLSFLLIFFQAWVVKLWQERRQQTKRWRQKAALILGGWLLWFGYGLAWHFSPKAFEGEPMRISVMQSGLDFSGGDPQEATQKAWTAYRQLHKADSSKDASLAVWGETVLRVYLKHQPEWLSSLQGLSKTEGKALIVGALDLAQEQQGEYNSAYLIDGSQPSQVYHKVRLFPFGEYIPFKQNLGSWITWPTTGDFVPGKALGFFRFKNANIGVTICYEAVFPDISQETVLKGANLLVNISDDGWLGGTPAVYFHFRAARLRAIETRRWIVRSSNSGVSAFIDPLGQIHQAIDFGVSAIRTQEVTLETQLSPYVRFFGGKTPWLWLSIFGGAWLAWERFSTRRRLAKSEGPN